MKLRPLAMLTALVLVLCFATTIRGMADQWLTSSNLSEYTLKRLHDVPL